MIICKRYSKAKYSKASRMVAKYEMTVISLFGFIPLYIKKIKTY